MTNKILKAIVLTVTGFTIAHGLLSLLILFNKQLYDQIAYHYSDSLIWYALFFLCPLVIGLVFWLWLKNKRILKGVWILFSLISIVQISFTLIASVKNYNYWGYAFKRPPVFSEILHASRLVTCSSVSNHDSGRLYVVADSLALPNDVYGSSDAYYSNTARPFRAFQDGASQHPKLYDFAGIYKNPDLKISQQVLSHLEPQIQKSGILFQGHDGAKVDGLVTVFITDDSSRYIMAGLKGGETMNDHYPFYEFLFDDNKSVPQLVKKQVYYVDFAGVEGMEYSNLAPFFSLLLTITGTVITIIITVTGIVIKRRKKIRHDTGETNIT